MSLRLVTVTAAALIASAFLSIPASATAASCGPAADIQPAVSQPSAQREATLCLINNYRLANHVKPLANSPTLATIAASYSERMVAQRFFAHIDPTTHSTIESRGRAYTTGTVIWALGENLAWGTGYRSSPAGAMEMWIKSPGHRANLLETEWQSVGIGIAAGTPVGAAGATYSAEFGSRVAKPTKRRVRVSKHRRHHR